MQTRKVELRLKLARVIWWLYLPCYLWAIISGLLVPDAIPAFAGMPLVIAAMVSAALVFRAVPQLTAVVIGTSLVQLVLAALLLGGEGRTWHLGTRDWVNPPGPPLSLGTLTWFVAALLPIVIAAGALRALRRARDRVSVTAG